MGLLLAILGGLAWLLARKGEKIMDSASQKVFSRREFLTQIKPLAERIQGRYGIPAALIITQAALESGWGLSGLTRQANNLFGFTGDGWKAEGKPVIEMPTGENSSRRPEDILYWRYPGDIISKTPDGKGGTVLKVKRPFRRYATWLESLEDWARLISTGARYALAYEAAKANNAKEFYTLLQKSGYATDPDYTKKLLAQSTAVKKALEELA